MLKLNREVGKKLIINGNVEIIVLQINGNRVSLGIEAPKEITVDREEIHARKVALAQKKLESKRKLNLKPRIWFKKRPNSQPTVKQPSYYCQP